MLEDNYHHQSETKEENLVMLKVKKGKPISDANVALIRRRNHSRLGAQSALSSTTPDPQINHQPHLQ